MHVHLARAVIEFRILGPLAVHIGGRVMDLGGLKQRMLLALLLTRANEPISFDYLVDTLWEDSPPARARNALQVYVSRLRKALAPDRITTGHGGYSLVVGPDELDLGRFRALVEDGRRAHAEGDPSRASELLTEGLALWRGSPLPEFSASRVFAAEIARLEDERLAALEDRIEADLHLQRHGEVVPELESLVAHHGLRERLVAQLMLALYRCGRQGEALETFRTARRGLVEELGLEPGRLLSELQQQILVQDPTLEPPRPPKRAAALRPSRRRLTLLLVGLLLTPGLDPEVAARVLARARQAVRAMLEGYGVVIEEPLGDVVLGAFGLPTAHEDDALRALRAAEELLGALEDNELRLQVAIDTGDVLAVEDRLADDQIAGWMIRLREAAHDGEIVIGEGTRRLVRGAVDLRESEVTGVWKVVDFDPTAEAIVRHFDVPLVGRDAELERLREAFDWVVSTQSAHLLTVIGPAGIGKSRLARALGELLEAEAKVLIGRCIEYGSGAFWPLADVVTQAAGGTRRVDLEGVLEGQADAKLVVDQLTAALGTEEGTSAEDAFWAFRRLFAALARERPLALVLEDIHWAETRLLDFVEELVERGENSSILVLCLARPELLEDRPSWGGGRLDAESIRLEPLSASSSEALIELLESDVPGEDRSRILQRAEGNPLFIEQMVALLAEDPDAAKEGIPPSIQAVLAARLARLADGERALLECASVVGLEFSAGDVTDLSSGTEGESVSEILRRLMRKELVRPAGPELEKRFRFRHILIRDAVYESVLKSRRAQLHERFARALGQRPEGASGADEIVGYHLERAYELRKELDPDDEHLERLATEAAERLVAAGRIELGRSDMRAAATLLTRGLSLMPAHTLERGDVLADLGYTLLVLGQWASSQRQIDEGFDLANRIGDAGLIAYLSVNQLSLRLYTEPSFSAEEFVRQGSRALSRLEAQRSSQLYAGRVSAVLAWAYAHRGQCRKAEMLLSRDGTLRSAKLLPSLWLYGPEPVGSAIKKCEALLARLPPPRTAASCYRCLAVLMAMTGRFEEARSLLDKDQLILYELGLTMLAAAASIMRGSVELLAARPRVAEEVLRAGVARLVRVGDSLNSSDAATLLARALYEQDNLAEALSMIELAEQGANRDVTVRVGMRGIRAKLLAREGQTAEAARLAQEGLRIAKTTDSPDLQGNAFADYADVLLLANCRKAALSSLESAVALYELKGDLISAARMRRQLEAL